VNRFGLFLVAGLLILLVSPSATQADTTSVFVNSTRLNVDVPPVVDSGRVLVPMRPIFEALGASVTWDGATGSVVGTRNGDTVKLTVGRMAACINGAAVELDVPPRLIRGRVLVPVRFVSEGLGESVYWFSDAKKVLVFSHNVLRDSLSRLAREVELEESQNIEAARALVISNSAEWRHLLLTRESWLTRNDMLQYNELQLHAVWFREAESRRFLARFVNRPFSLDQPPYEQMRPDIVDLVAFVDLCQNEPVLQWLARLGYGEGTAAFGDDPIDTALKTYTESWPESGWGYAVVGGSKPDLPQGRLQGYRQGPGYWFPFNCSVSGY